MLCSRMAAPRQPKFAWGSSQLAASGLAHGLTEEERHAPLGQGFATSCYYLQACTLKILCNIMLLPTECCRRVMYIIWRRHERVFLYYYLARGSF